MRLESSKKPIRSSGGIDCRSTRRIVDVDHAKFERNNVIVSKLPKENSPSCMMSKWTLFQSQWHQNIPQLCINRTGDATISCDVLCILRSVVVLLCSFKLLAVERLLYGPTLQLVVLVAAL
jgi:hypothetical protein